MSKIKEALDILKREAPPRVDKPAVPHNGFDAGADITSVPVGRKKKVAVEGPRYAVDQQQLIKAGLLAPMDHAAPVADEFRRIKRPLIANAAKARDTGADHMNVIMITSAMPNAGKTFCSMNLAVSISLERELNVLLVDADVAKRHISRELGLAEAPGLIDLLLDESRNLDDALVRTDMNDVQVLPAGRHHPQATELLASERMSRIVDELATRYSDRIILLDSPPLLITSEAQALASQVGQIALVVEAGATTQQSLLQTIEVLDSDKAINIILNKSRHSSQFGYYGDYGYYGYE
ncbi:MAG: XrtA-associated tyrosine autokinase [Woeseia sp.]